MSKRTHERVESPSEKTSSEKKRKSPEPDEEEPVRRRDFFNVELEDGVPTTRYSFVNESRAGQAWIAYQFWSRSVFERHAYVNFTRDSKGGLLNPGYQTEEFASWPDSAAKRYYESELLKYFMLQSEDVPEDDPEEDYKALLAQGKVTPADVAEDRYLRYLKKTTPVTGNQEADALIGLYEDPHMFRDSFLHTWSPFCPNSGDASAPFPVPEYKIAGEDTMLSLIELLHSSRSPPASPP